MELANGEEGHPTIDARHKSQLSSSSSSFKPYRSIITQPHRLAVAPDKPTPSASPSQSPDKSSPASETPTTTMTDSGITHTIPNDNQVTVTMHTTVTQGIPTTSSTPSANETTPGSPPTDTGTVTLPTQSNAATLPDRGSEGGMSSGTVAGIAISGAVIFAALCILFFVWRRRRARSSTQYSSDSTRQEAFASHEAALGEKDYPWPWPLSNTRRASEQAGRLGLNNSGDPFGPFGGTLPRTSLPFSLSCLLIFVSSFAGRADKTYDSCAPPPPNTFEMDGVDTAVAELPAAASEPRSQPSSAEQTSNGTKQGTLPASSPDPRATLGNLRNEDGRPTYVNQWSQYVALTGQRGGAKQARVKTP